MAELTVRSQADEALSANETGLAEHLNLIRTSGAFESSTTGKRLLEYLFEHRNDSVNEYSIAVEALQRSPDFDPQIDATVRVQISRLRRRLKDFYLSAGAGTPIRFTIPLGSHQLIVDGIANAPLPASTTQLELHPLSRALPAPPIGPANHRLPSRMLAALLVLGCLVVALAGICLWQYGRLRVQSQVVSGSLVTPLLPFWRDFYANGKPIQIVLPNPTFFHWKATNGSDLMVRDTFVNGFMDIDESSELATLHKRFGEPDLVQAYAVSSDIVAALQLMHYLDMRSVDVSTSISSNASSDQFEQKNLILLGTEGTLTPFKVQMDRLYFRFTPHSHDYIVPNPQPIGNEPREFKRINESATRHLFPGIIALIPGSTKDSYILILQGAQTAAIVSYLTSTAGCQQLRDAQKRAGNNPFFEAVILSEVEGNTALNSNLASFRGFAPKPAQN